MVITEKFAMVLKWSLHNHLVGYSKLVCQKQLQKVLFIFTCRLCLKKVRYKFVFN